MPSLLLNPGPSTMNFFSSSLPLPSFFFRNRKKCYDLNPPEESHQVTYLGNMLTIMGKGDTSIDRPLEVITRAWGATVAKGATRHGAGATFGQQQAQQLAMRLCVCRSGLRAETCMGVTEYFTHRITWSAAPSQYPRVFCWIYKHEGKRMKPELRCHAVLCRRADEPQQMHQTLRRHLQSALQEYKREKASAERTRHRRNSVLHFASSAGTAAASVACSSNSGGGGEHAQLQQQQSTTMMMPRRKAVLQTGALNFRPPLSRSRSVPRLCSIDEEEARAEEQEDECDETVKDEDEELQLSSSDLDSLNTADHYQPVPMPTATTTMANAMASFACVAADQQTITDSSCRSSTCGDELEDEDDYVEDEERRHFRAEHHHQFQRHADHHHTNDAAAGRENGDDGCSADSGYSTSLHT
ncbi:hypothetical protein niasHT_038159 [Heterodera trifolii]|uniref:PID domain-containing protein n=1 Tax=Heterodera trifolii TaxID=157864 RepID=A0ABD2I6A6_9BILA